jgi:hypothetical protein
MDLITDADIAALVNQVNRVYDTYKREVFVRLMPGKLKAKIYAIMPSIRIIDLKVE